MKINDGRLAEAMKIEISDGPFVLCDKHEGPNAVELVRKRLSEHLVPAESTGHSDGSTASTPGPHLPVSAEFRAGTTASQPT
jgi:hypothetical protein